jgi:alpha-ketoglutarate-dependent taurine dioxygenase
MPKPVFSLKRPAAITVADDEIPDASLVTFEELVAGQALPLVIRARLDGVDLVEWASHNGASIGRLLRRHGGILFRGFGVREPDTLARVMAALSTAPVEYVERSSPRTHLTNNVYTSTEHPADQEIFLHNEQSYNLTFPLLIAFACAVPASEGGATPIADVRLVHARIPRSVREKFGERGYLYVRNYGAGLGLTWQDAFQTQQPSEVEAYCRRQGIELEWQGSDRLRTRQVRRTGGRHPKTGEEVWFNHATFFHPTTLSSGLFRALAAAMGSMENFPNATFYGDGEPIEPEVMDQLRAAYRSCTVRFSWRPGDLLLLDNMLVAHGRDPYTGPRKILTAMADLVGWDQVG